MKVSSVKYIIVAARSVLASTASPETGAEAWLRYAPITDTAQYKTLPLRIVTLGNSSMDQSAKKELQRVLSSMLGRQFTVDPFPSGHVKKGSAIILGAVSVLQRIAVVEQSGSPVAGEQYRLAYKKNGQSTRLIVRGGTPQSEMYAVFHLLAVIAAQKQIPEDDFQSPSSPARWNKSVGQPGWFDRAWICVPVDFLRWRTCAE